MKHNETCRELATIFILALALAIFIGAAACWGGVFVFAP